MTTSAPLARAALRDLVAVGRDDDPVGDADLGHALPDADDEWEAGEESEGFSGETRRTQSGWDHGERPHARRSGGMRTAESTPTAATVTSLNVN